MIAYSDGNLHDIDHFLRVWSYARTIGALEGLDAQTQFLLEAAALVHDIACPLCREKYGNTDGKAQEREGAPLTRAFFAESDLTGAQIERIAWLVGHHHTFAPVDGIDHQILLEADYIANASECGYGKAKILQFSETLCKTDAGRRLLREVFSL
ncbi:MAG: HD domain-containing protein [Oscillibacter sp.]|nr:HD domain-containing protein [Oscillibacter sp.]